MCCNFQKAAQRTIGNVWPVSVSCGHLEQFLFDKLKSCLACITSEPTHPPRLPLPDHVHSASYPWIVRRAA